MDNNDLTFFTNEPERNLYDRFNKILNKNTQFFDVLVGYFRASGFYLLQDSLQNVEKIRILIGINTDEKVLNMYKEAKGQIELHDLSNIEAIDLYKKNIENEFKDSNDIKEVEDGVNKFIEYIKNGKLELRVYTKQPIHAKVYVMKDFEDSPDYGRVITGSSNFSKSGLVNNLEFNVELKNSTDVKFASKKFEELWKESQDISQECVDTIKNKTWIKNDITPYEMYIKFLYEYFKEEINDDLIESLKNSDYHPEGFIPLQYQKDAIKQARRILKKHNGVFISDVVGLGKTYICAMLAQVLHGKKLILCPPVLIDYWEKVMRDFFVPGVKVESEGKLDKLIEEGVEEYSYIFVDESHRFRNSDTEQYKALHEICVGKKVILISATPQNNYNTDIANQLYLFQEKYNSTIVGTRNLENFFLQLDKNLKKYEKGTLEYKQQLKYNSKQIRDKVLREVMIRRTRTEIEKNYSEDLEKQGLKFPKVKDPIKLTYEFSEDTENVFIKTLTFIKKMNYSRYKPLTYVNQNKLTPNQKTLLIGQKNMGAFMKGLLVKRLESSKYAFEMSVNRFIQSYEEYIRMYNEDKFVNISKKNNYESKYLEDNIENILSETNDNFLFKASDFEENFIVDLESDLKILKELKYIWKNLSKDDKMEYFLGLLKSNEILKNNKLIIFTESKETADYLKENIEKRFNENTLLYSGSMPNSIRKIIRENYDPNYNKNNQKNNYRILVTTDVLAEGINLHRSNVIVNYDLPWNPTKIMQRVGRVNRIGTNHSTINVFNFFPTSKSNEHMSLEDNIITKMQMFHDILGEDSKILTENEEVSVHELFKKMNDSITDEEEGFSELTYLKLIREIRNKDYKLFEKIINYPVKIKIARNKDENGLLTFFRRGDLKRFYFTQNNNTEEINFQSAIEKIKANKLEKSKSVDDNYYELLNLNKTEFENSENEYNYNKLIWLNKKGSSSVKKLRDILKFCLKDQIALTDNEKEKIKKIIKLLENGKLPEKIIKTGNKMSKNIKKVEDFITFYKEFEMTIPEVYIEEANKLEIKRFLDKEDKEIILSEEFI